MRLNHSLVLTLLLGTFLATGEWAPADEPAQAPDVIARPDAFETLIHPNCSHCRVEANRRQAALRDDDRVLCWVQVQTDNYVNDGVIPIRFFLNAYRVLSDSWGIFVHDPDAGFARGFAPDDGPFRFYGWRKGVMVMKSDQDGTLYSCLTGVAFDGPKKGHRLEPRPTLVTDWGFWQKRYPQSVAYFMYDKYQPVDLPGQVNGDSRKSRPPVDGRLPADTMVLGVWDGKQARAYPLDALEKAGVIHDTADGRPRIVFWYGPTRTAAAYHQPWGTSGLQGDAGWIFRVDETLKEAPFTNQRIGLHWDITGRAVEGGPRLIGMDSVQVKWFAWAAEYPETSIYGQEVAAGDSKPFQDSSHETAKPHGNLDIASRRFALVQGVDVPRERVTLLIDGETEPKQWPLRPDAEIWHDGWWGRLDQFAEGQRVWVWFDTDDAKRFVAVSLLADELSQQAFYAPPEFDEAFKKRRAAQQALLRRRWADEGLPGTLIFLHPDRRQVELILDHEALPWARSLQAGEQVTIRAADDAPAVVRQVRPWRERTQLLLEIDASSMAALTVGERVKLRSTVPRAESDEDLPPGLGKSQNKADRLEWLMSAVYCTCGMHDGCAGHFFTLAACDAGQDKPCGLAKRTREELGVMIDKGYTDRAILDELLSQRGGNLLRPHMLP
ncbi:MAG TPA: DUF3179 domain-containing (seleno)protein [Pirellulales bacterium]|nr:DUF3179 domain-containing (seleno)protein [Pirellulales bacterium]